MKMKKVLLIGPLLLGQLLIGSTSTIAQTVLFSANDLDNDSGTGIVGSSSFSWSATPGYVNEFENPTDFGWGIAGDGYSTGFNFTITMNFDNPWTFNAIQFEALNTDTADSVFNFQLLDSSLKEINTSSAVASTTSGFDSAPWNYNITNKSWEYSTIANSINGHQAAITGQYNDVSRLIINVDDHLGLDYFNLDMEPAAVPVPSAFCLLGPGLLTLLGLSRRNI